MLQRESADHREVHLTERDIFRLQKARYNAPQFLRSLITLQRRLHEHWNLDAYQWKQGKNRILLLLEATQ